MIQIAIHILYSLWPIIVIIGVIAGILSFFFAGVKLKKTVCKVPYKIIAILGILVMCLSGATSYFCSEVPKATGYTFDSALISLRNADLDGKLAPGNTYDANKLIDAQSIEAGTVIKKHTIVELSYRYPVNVEEFTGEKVSVPNVVGMEQMEATSLLTERGLQFQVWWTDNGDFEYSDTYYIIGQSIPAGSDIPAGTLIKLELSPMKP